MSSNNIETSATLNIPQLVIIAVFGVLVFRWISASRASDDSGSGSSSASVDGTGSISNTVNFARADSVATMFPHLNRRHIMWDLQRNGGDVQATTERILDGRGLEVPPINFQASDPPSVPPQPRQQQLQQIPVLGEQLPRSFNGGATGSDLIQRYKLDSKISLTSDEVEGAETNQTTEWNSSKNDRSNALLKRREEMILAARRKLLAKEKK